MSNFISRLAENATRTVKNWWLFLIGGILCIGAGIAVFCNPIEGYAALTLLFGVVILVVGLVELIVAMTSRNYFMMRGYNVVGGILDILIGILLCANPGFTAVALPILLGIWLMYHSFMIIGFAGDLHSFNVPGAAWGIVGGVLLLVLSLFITFKPFSFGAGAVTILTGVALVIVGALLICGGVKLRKLHTSVKELFDAKIDY